MFGLERKTKGRRQRAKQLRAETGESPWQWFSRRVGFWPTFVTFVFFAMAMLIAAVGERALPYSVGQKVAQPITARVDFTVDDPEQGEANIRAAREAVPNYYRVKGELIDRIAGELAAMFEAAQAESFEAFQERAKGTAWPADQRVYNALHAADQPTRDRFTRSLDSLNTALRTTWTALPTADVDRRPASTATEVIIQYPQPETEANAEAGSDAPFRAIHERTVQLIQITSRDAVEGRSNRLARVFDPLLEPAVEQTLVVMLSREPILVYDSERTHKEMAAAEQNALPGVRTFAKGDSIVFAPQRDPGTKGDPEKSGLTSADLELLRIEHQAYAAYLESDDPGAIAWRAKHRYEQVGLGMVLMVLTVSLFLYVGLYQPRVFQVPARTIALVGVLLLALLAVRFIDMRYAGAEFVLTPVLLVASILTISYPARFAAGVTMIFVVTVALLIRAEVGAMIMLFTGAYVTALRLNLIRTRTRILTTGVLTAGLVFLTSFASSLVNHVELSFALWRAGTAAGGAVLAALIIQGVLPFVERIFNVATALTLLEYRDANRPVLQRLAREAPGTYNHSLVLGSMAEAACEAIGANGLLAHVGALYHDIGKIPKAEYFAENQEASINRHDTLAPSMSLLIILGHVKDGLELAKEYGLPRVLFPFIAEHHGTTVVRYFHHVASEQQPKKASGRHDREVAEAEFRYPGPKPSSKESAILMLCDGVEGAVRALHEPTAGRIEGVVSQVLQARLKDGQFDDCEITLRELHRVEESLVKSLCRFYHGRVAYPKDSSSKTAPGKESTPGDSKQVAV